MGEIGKRNICNGQRPYGAGMKIRHGLPALLVALYLLLGAGFANSQEAQIKRTIEGRYGVKVESVIRTPYSNLYEVVVSGDERSVIYTDEKAGFLFTGQIIDLGEEKVYKLDLRKKTYTVAAFADLRRAMEEGRKKAEEEAKREQPAEAKKDPNATRYDQVSFAEVMAKDLKVMDATAIAFCRDNSIPIVVFDLLKPGNLRSILEGKPVGTLVG